MVVVVGGREHRQVWAKGAAGRIVSFSFTLAGRIVSFSFTLAGRIVSFSFLHSPLFSLHGQKLPEATPAQPARWCRRRCRRSRLPREAKKAPFEGV